MDTFQKRVPIDIRKLSEEFYNFLNEWEPEELNIATEGEIEATNNDDKTKERVFTKSCNACVPVYLPTVNRSYLEIRSDWLLENVGAQLGKMCDFYIAKFSEDYG